MVPYEADPFRQLEELLPTPNRARTAWGGATVHWQQEADYDIEVRVGRGEAPAGRRRCATGISRTLPPYLWLQLDQDLAKDGGGNATEPAPGMELGYKQLDFLLESEKFDGG